MEIRVQIFLGRTVLVLRKRPLLNSYKIVLAPFEYVAVSLHASLLLQHRP